MVMTSTRTWTSGKIIEGPKEFNTESTLRFVVANIGEVNIKLEKVSELEFTKYGRMKFVGEGESVSDGSPVMIDYLYDRHLVTCPMRGTIKFGSH